MKKSALFAAAAALAVVTTPTQAKAGTWGNPSDGQNAYVLACVAMWLMGIYSVCGELPGHPCKSSSPPEQCPKKEGDDFGGGF